MSRTKEVIVEDIETHIFHGPEDINKWLEWLSDTTKKIRNGYLFTQDFKLRKGIPTKNLVRIEKVEPEEFDVHQRFLYKAVYLVKPKSQSEFLKACKEYFVISDDDLFVRLYYK